MVAQKWAQFISKLQQNIFNCEKTTLFHFRFRPRLLSLGKKNKERILYATIFKRVTLLRSIFSGLSNF